MRATTIVVIAMFAVEISAIVVEVCDNKRRIVNFIVIVNAIALQHLNGDQRSRDVTDPSHLPVGLAAFCCESHLLVSPPRTFGFLG